MVRQPSRLRRDSYVYGSAAMNTGPQQGDAVVTRTDTGWDATCQHGPIPGALVLIATHHPTYKEAESAALAYATGRIWVDIDGYPILITL
jgi:hypothetical protein